jgi:myo-inositol 2-dehydrogenase/D-chiro-inositol 1-dehydrogenase
MTRPGIALIGAGRIGRIHAHNVVADGGARLRYVIDADAGAATRLAGETGAQVADVELALADPDIRAILVASPTDTHSSLIEAGVRAGKAVFCEKPLDLDVACAARALQTARDRQALLALGFNRRFDPAFARLQREIAGGRIGQVEVVSITSRDPSPPPATYVARSGGLFRDMMIHDLDMARWLLGEEPVSVFARGSALVDAAIGAAGDVDTAVVVLQTAGGRLAQITNSRRCSYGYDQRIEVFGSAGLVRADNVPATTVETADASGFSREPALPFFLERYAAAYRAELAEFLKALRGEPARLVSGQDGLRALQLADAAQRSLESGRLVEI